MFAQYPPDLSILWNKGWAALDDPKYDEIGPNYLHQMRLWHCCVSWRWKSFVPYLFFFSLCTSFSVAFPNYSSLRISHFAYNTNMVITVRNEVAKVMFLQACVCPHGGGGWCLPQCMLGYPPRANTPQGADTPPSHPGADTPPGETATAADGTHPTGMHSCFKELFLL